MNDGIDWGHGDSPPWVATLGAVGLFGFALFAFFGIAGANIGIALMLIAAWFDRRRFWPVLRRDPVWWFFVWCAAAVALGSAVRVWQFPGEAAEQWSGLLDLLQLYLFVLVAWWLHGRQHFIFWLLALALAGLCLGVARKLDADSLAALFALQRPSFLWSINALGHYAAAALLGMGVLTPRLWRRLAKGFWRWPILVGWSALMLLAATLMLLSLSRGVWLASGIVVAGLLLYRLWLQRLAPAAAGRALTAGTVAALLVVIALSAAEPVRSRVAVLGPALVEVWTADGGLGQLSDESGRIRVQLLRLGMDSWRESPWLGGGPYTPVRVIQAHGDQLPDSEHYSDFHNLVVDLLASFGVLGSAPLVLTFLWVLWVAGRGRRTGRLDRDLYLCLVGLLVLNALAQMTDTRILSHHGRFYWMLLAGAAYSWWLAARSAGGSAQSSARR